MKISHSINVKRMIAVFILFLISYELWLVLDRWFALTKYIMKFGVDAGPWISLGLDTVIFGFASLALMCVFSLIASKSAVVEGDYLSKRIFFLNYCLSLFTVVALSILILLPTTSFR